MNRFTHIFKKIISKFRLLDWIILCIIICGLAYVLISLTLQPSWITIEFRVNGNYSTVGGSEPPPYWIADKIRAGDISYDNLGQKELVILDVKSWGFQSKETWVKASVKTKYSKQLKRYTFEYMPLEIGRPIDIAINGTNIRGAVTYVEGIADTREMQDIVVKAGLNGIDIYYANGIKNGQIMYDTLNRPIAEILDMENKPAEVAVETSDGRIVTSLHPLKRDVLLTIKLKAVKQNGSFFFLETQPIKIGFNISLFFPQMMITPFIKEIL